MEAIAAVVGITEATIRTTSKLWKLSNAWRDAPADLHRLRDDLSRTEHFFTEVRHSALLSKPASGDSWDRRSPFQTELKLLIDGGIEILGRIETFVDSLVSDDAPGHPTGDLAKSLGKRRRLGWITNSRKVTQMRNELRIKVSHICRILITHNVSISTEIHSAINGIKSRPIVEAEVSGATETSQHAIFRHVDSQMAAMEGKLVAIIEQSVKENVSSLQQQWPIFHALPRQHEAGRGRLPEYQRQEVISASERSTQKVALVQQTTQTMAEDHELRCRCHASRRYHFEISALGSSYLGLVGVTYQTESTISPECRSAACKRHQEKSRSFRGLHLHLVYHLPGWLTRAALSLSLSSNLNGSPEARIRIFNHIPNSRDVGISAAIRRGDAASVRAMLEEGRASVHDIIGVQRCSPLWLAMVLHHVDVVRILLQAGADPYHETESYHGSSPIRAAFERSLSGRAVDVELANLFPLWRYYDDEDYSPLHLSILGVLRLDLATALRQPSYIADINRSSGDGLTPLLTAAIRGDTPAVRLLLRAGADVELASAEGIRPLHSACRNGHDDIVRLLLSAGACVNTRDSYNRTALTNAAACTHHDPDKVVRILAMLLRHGSRHQVNEGGGESSRGVPPLHYAVSAGMVESARFLIEAGGADINQRSDGRTPLFTAMALRRHDAVRFLLDSGADVTAVTDYGWGVLHFLANDGDEEMMRLFIGGLLCGKGLKVNMADEEGRTPWQLLAQRANPDERIWEEFTAVLESLEEVEGEEEEEGDDEFVDALETIPVGASV